MTFGGPESARCGSCFTWPWCRGESGCGSCWCEPGWPWCMGESGCGSCFTWCEWSESGYVAYKFVILFLASVLAERSSFGLLFLGPCHRHSQRMIINIYSRWLSGYILCMMMSRSGSVTAIMMCTCARATGACVCVADLVLVAWTGMWGWGCG